MNIFWILLIVFSANAQEEPKFCEEPSNVILRNDPPDRSKIAPSLLNPEEMTDSEAGRKLASTPGPYGHSELGFRYLARLFGYPHKFEGREKVEAWIAEQEINNRRQKNGLRKIWQKWVVKGEYRLSVPPGAIAQIPANANADIFFKDLYAKGDFSRCVNLEQSLLFCKNYAGGSEFGSSESSAYAGNKTVALRLGTATSELPCKVTDYADAMWDRKMEVEARAKGYGTRVSEPVSDSAQ